MRTMKAVGAACLVAVLMGGALYWAMSGDDVPPVAGDLRGLDEIDLGAAEGADVRFGSTSGEVVPMIVSRPGRGETSLSLVDAESGTVLDAGPLPVDGWGADVLPEASDRFVAMTAHVCRSELVATDAGPDCAEDSSGLPVPIELLVYDLAREQWQAVPIGSIPDQWVTLDWVDDSTATVQDVGDGTAGASTWAQVDLVDPSPPTAYSTTKPTPPSDGRQAIGHEKPWAGDGWTMTNPEGSNSELIWQGNVRGEPLTVTIPSGQVMTAAGRCVLIGSTSGTRLVHLHRLCAS